MTVAASQTRRTTCETSKKPETKALFTLHERANRRRTTASSERAFPSSRPYLAPVPDAPNSQPGTRGSPSLVEVIHFANPVVKWIMATLYIAGVLLAAWAAYWFVETPGRAFFGRLAKRLRAQPSSNARLAPVRDKTMEQAP